ncbi:hypothetical protein KMC60_gp05 [Achromobacter phage vB_AxyP_19-32_Axy11]|uniref:Uncharacterized protein n=2 Tax=Pourcelvirus Axy11 TaxID=2843622 RepID=A0A514CW14_9CAUD|nr:hypothetical protein KMC60_gp05 [Achromobacter phage vB_AxyP_19-32_Axy11]QDH84068.1 hypothetical protein Axy11_005 [Achromobacter phage vB_AxyP_19-32_Axy11]QDH84661.1 hypothetical protein Axy22_004 [Achromobacter phage vB_AxyP_19-32_Axy22]
MLFKELKDGDIFTAGMIQFRKIHPIHLDGCERNAVVMSENGGPLLPKGLHIQLHGDIQVELN